MGASITIGTTLTISGAFGLPALSLFQLKRRLTLQTTVCLVTAVTVLLAGLT